MDGLPNGKPILQDTSLNKLTEQQQQARLANLQEMQEKRDTAKKAVDDFLAGENSVDYVRKMNFAMDDQIHQEFMGLDMENWIQNKYNKPLSQLSPDEFTDAAQQWGFMLRNNFQQSLMMHGKNTRKWKNLLIHIYSKCHRKFLNMKHGDRI